jgi:thymidylate synthase
LTPVFIVERTLDSMWFNLLSEVWNKGSKTHIDTGSFAGSNRLEFDFVAGTIKFPATRPLSPIVPDGVPPVTTEEDIEKYFVNYIMDGNLDVNEHYRYSTWISGGDYVIPIFNSAIVNNVTTKWSGTFVVKVPNQVQWCIDHYKKKGFGNNHCYIQVGYPESNLAYDRPYTDEASRGTSPCLRGIDTKILDGVLHLHAYFRSWDLFAGFPENMGGILLLMEYMANELGVEVGTLSFSSMKCHLYDSQLEAVKARLNIE